MKKLHLSPGVEQPLLRPLKPPAPRVTPAHQSGTHVSLSIGPYGALKDHTRGSHLDLAECPPQGASVGAIEGKGREFRDPARGGINTKIENDSFPLPPAHSVKTKEENSLLYQRGGVICPSHKVKKWNHQVMNPIVCLFLLHHVISPFYAQQQTQF